MAPSSPMEEACGSRREQDSGAAIYRLPVNSQYLSTIYTGPAHSSVLWLSSIGSTVWADIANGSDGHEVDVHETHRL